MHERGWHILSAVDRVAREHGASPSQVALAWLLQRPAVVAPITGANSPEQVRESIAATELVLSPDEVRLLDTESGGSDR
jgi:aryl-alcohol dehydrogenase-like predicted oxidoreductase